jgi:hypothetical protein
MSRPDSVDDGRMRSDQHSPANTKTRAAVTKALTLAIPNLVLAGEESAAPRGQRCLTRESWIAAAARTFWLTLCEIFDESAYARFLARQRMVSSPGSYAAFLRETERTRARRPRCC